MELLIGSAYGSTPDVDTAYDGFYKTIDTVIMGFDAYSQIIGCGEYPYGGTNEYVYTMEYLPSNANAHSAREGPDLSWPD